MSGQQSPQVAEAALTYALQAEAAAKGLTVREVAVARIRAAASERFKARERVSLPARTWARMPEPTRLVLVMLGSEAPGEAQRLCKQPWDSFSEADQCRMAAAARGLRRDLQDASSLF